MKVIFDMETTGFTSDDDIIQITALCGDETFSLFAFLHKPFNPEASKKTGLSLQVLQAAWCLIHNGSAVPGSTMEEAARSFIQWLASRCGQVVLFGHNTFSFHRRTLFNLLERVNLIQQFLSTTVEFLNSVPDLKEQYPGRPSYKQEDL